MKGVRLDPSMVKEDSMEWRLYDATPEFRRWAAPDEHGNLVIKTEYLADDALLEQNKREYDESHSKRFGDGKVVASVPLNKFYREVVPYIKDGDQDFMKWWLNHPDNRVYRSFRGKV